MSLCTVPDCDGVLLAHGLCQKHYSRRRRGAPLTDPPRIVPAFGEYGELDDDGDTIMCHICGVRLPTLGNHVRAVHGIPSRDYKQTYGLPLSRGLESATATLRRSQASTARIGGDGWRRFEGARDPQAAADARTPEAFTSPAVTRHATSLAHANNQKQIIPTTTCRDCGTTIPRRRNRRPRLLCDDCLHTQKQEAQVALTRKHRDENAERDALICALRTQMGLPKAQIARRVGVSDKTVQTILRRNNIA